MSLSTLSEWLRCPICLSPLWPAPPLVLGCDNDHRFDAHKRGYASMLASQPKIAGDTREMLDARTAVLDSGAYDPVARVVSEEAMLSSPGRLIDAGCGTGHYAAATAALMAPEARLLLTDISPDAVHRALRRVGRTRADGLVGDTWRPLPLRSATADVVLNVFAPHNLGEFHRILRPGGALIVATPQVDHLAELRRSLPMLNVPDAKVERLTEAATPLFRHERTLSVRYTLEPTHESAVALRAMGPAAHHPRPHDASAVALPRAVTVAVDVTRLTALT